MADRPRLTIEVAYALPERQRVVEIEVAPGTSARVAARQSGLDAEFDLDLDSVPLGVWGQPVDDAHVLSDGDRLELYRPLLMDPREMRRRRARGDQVGADS